MLTDHQWNLVTFIFMIYVIFTLIVKRLELTPFHKGVRQVFTWKLCVSAGSDLVLRIMCKGLSISNYSFKIWTLQGMILGYLHSNRSYRRLVPSHRYHACFDVINHIFRLFATYIAKSIPTCILCPEEGLGQRIPQHWPPFQHCSR